MAHLAKSGVPVCRPSKALLERQQFASLLGLVASEWVSLEVGLSFLYATLLGKYLPHSQRQGPPIHPIGMQIFKAIESIHKRTELLKQLSNTLITRKSLISELEKLIEQVRKAGKGRNELVHGYWGFNDEEYPDDILRIESPGEFVVYKESDFMRVIDLIIKTDRAVASYEEKVRKYLKRKKRPFRE